MHRLYIQKTINFTYVEFSTSGIMTNPEEEGRGRRGEAKNV